MDFNNQNVLGKEQNNNGEAVDRISELPDPLIQHILSFLDIKHVARTSILSNRWSRIWTSIPILDLQFWNPYAPPPLSEINKFMDFVDRLFILHDGSSIQKFALNLYSDMNASRVHSWIEKLTRKCNVEELSLYIDYDQDIPLSIPISLFTCGSLVKLELTACPSMHFPKNFFFPKLKSLTLSQVEFANGCWTEQPFSNCLVLEELFLRNCFWVGVTKFCILTPVLKVLEIDNELEEDEEELKDCDLKIHAPNLVSLRYWGSVAKDYDLSSFLTIDKAEVEFYDYESGSEGQRISHAISKFLQALSNVRCLSICVRTEQVLAYTFVSNLPIFQNLNKLKLLCGATTDKLIFTLLKAAPSLKCLVLAELCDSHSDDDIEYDETEDLFRHLQFVRFWQFRGKARELRWAKLILKNANSLQTMTIAFTKYPKAKNKEAVMSELPSLPRASESCAVKFV